MSSTSLDDLVRQFALAVIGQRNAISELDSESGNRLATNYYNVAKSLIGRGQEGLTAFAQLLNDPRSEVRTMAAAFLIPYRTEESKAILEEAAREPGITGLGAIMALRRWETDRKGIE